MGRLALTLWFTVTAVLWPGWCCAFACGPCPIVPAPPGGVPVQPDAPPKSCCHHATPCAGHDRPEPEPLTPADCPCDHDKPAAVPPGGTTAADLAVRLLDASFTALPFGAGPDLSVSTTTSARPTPPDARLAGRDLLAVYSLLRC